MDSPTQPSPPLLDPPHSPHSAIPPHVFVDSPLPACCFNFSEEKRKVNFAVALVALSRNVQRSDRGTVAATASHCIFEWMEQSRVWEGRPGLLLPRARQPTFTITIVAGAGLEVDVVGTALYSTLLLPLDSPLRRHAVSLSDAPAAKPRGRRRREEMSERGGRERSWLGLVDEEVTRL